METNKTALQGFSWYLPEDGQHWNRLRALVGDFVSKGITAVWLPPAYKGAAGVNDVGYGVYDLFDLGEFDQKGSVPTKYGTRDEYLACVAALHEAGLRVMVDIVLNQRMGADECEWVRAVAVAREDRNRQISDVQTIEAWTKFTFPGRKGAYSDFVWDWRCFHGVDYNAANGDGSIFLFEGKHWDSNVTHENGNFDYLMGCDVDLLYGPVYDELVRWGVWYVNTTQAESLRLDAIKHMEREFYLRWLRDVQQAVGRELFVVGEYWESNIGALEGYLGSERIMSLFDVFLHFRMRDASLSNGDFDLSKIFDGTLVQARPQYAVTFVDNHDTQAGQALESAIKPWFVPLAYAVILLRPQGYPCVFYGNYYGVKSMEGPSFHKRIDLMMDLRKTNVYGAQHDYFDDPDVVGWTMEGDEEHGGNGLAVVLTNRTGGDKAMLVGKQHAGEIWVDAMQHMKNEVVIDEEGFGVFSCENGSLSIWVKKE